MAGIKALRKIQGGKETTAGTAVVATMLWRGVGVLEDAQELKTAEEDVGYISGLDRVYIPKLLAKLAMENTPATFEQLPYLGEAGIKAVGTGVADGAGGGKIYAYPMPTTQKNTLNTYTLEGGDDQQAEEMEYGFVEGFKLSGKGGEAIMMSADWVGRQIALASFTASIAVPSVEEILFGKGVLYIDATTIGTTVKSSTLLGMDLTVKTGWVPVFSADGFLYFSFAKVTMPEVTLALTFEHDATGVAEKAACKAKTRRLVRLKFTGTAVTSGTAYNAKTLVLDFGGKWDKFDKLGEQDGNDIVQGTFRARPSETDSTFFTMTVVNALTSLT